MANDNLYFVEGYLEANKEGLSEEKVKDLLEKVKDLRSSSSSDILKNRYLTDSPTYGPGPNNPPLSDFKLDIKHALNIQYCLVGITAKTKIGRTTFDKTRANDVLIAKNNKQQYLFAAFVGYRKSDGSAVFQTIDSPENEPYSDFFTPNSRVKIAGRFLKLPEDISVETLLTDDVEEADSVKIGRARRKSKKKKPDYNPNLNEDEKKLVKETSSLATMEELENFHKKSETKDA